MREKISLLLVFSVFLGQSLWGQKAKLKNASSLMIDKNYQAAIEVYLEILNKQQNQEAVFNIAKCYRAIKDTLEMEYWYEQCISLPEFDKEWLWYYSDLLSRRGKSKLLRPYLNEYIQKEGAHSEAAKIKLDSLNAYFSNLEPAFDRSELYSIENYDTYNGVKDDFFPTFYLNQLLFSSHRDVGMDNDMFTPHIFLVDDTDRVKWFNLKIFEDKDIISCNFSKGGDSLIFCAQYPMTEHAKLYQSFKKKGSWSEPELIPFCKGDYSTMHPSLAPNGKELYFSSRRPEGFGGMDIYRSVLTDRGWTEPQNLGKTINTERDDMMPFVQNDKLYFASDGHKGLGRLDLFESTWNGSGWELPKNLGMPINSEFDDFGLVQSLDQKSGYFTSNRAGGKGGDDIYKYKHNGNEKEPLKEENNR